MQKGADTSRGHLVETAQRNLRGRDVAATGVWVQEVLLVVSGKHEENAENNIIYSVVIFH